MQFDETLTFILVMLGFSKIHGICPLLKFSFMHKSAKSNIGYTTKDLNCYVRDVRNLIGCKIRLCLNGFKIYSAKEKIVVMYTE